MSKRICQNCGKGIMRGHKVSHAKQRTKKVYKPNLHKSTLYINGVKKKLLLCTKCLKTLKKKATPKKTLKLKKKEKKAKPA